MKRLFKSGRGLALPVLQTAALACLSVSAWGDEHAVPGHTLETGAAAHAPVPAAPFSPIHGSAPGGLDFDLGGSDTRKLQLQLGQPLTLTTGTNARLLDDGTDVLGLDATLSVPLADRFSVSTSASQQLGNSRFLSLGNIQCMNGTLRADSYTASGCRFIQADLGGSEQKQFNLGASLDLDHGSASVNWFNQESSVSRPAVGAAGSISPRINNSHILSPNLGNPLLSDNGPDPLQYLNSEASGVNLNFQVGIATDLQGDVQLGLAFARIYEAEYRGLYADSNESLAWTIAQPFNSARMSLEWSHGAFSSGIHGYYRDQVDFLSRNSVDSLATFDVHFTWRTPWNANLSVGATNVLNAGSESSSATEAQPIDPLESVYGRIPYVRYKQDL